jgi:tetratricopeptide (TPR) repeat protein
MGNGHPLGPTLSGFALPLAAGATVLFITGVTAWPAWLMVFAVAGISAAMSWRRATSYAPVGVGTGDDHDHGATGGRIYAMQHPLRTVAGHGVPEAAPYTVEVTTQSQLALIAPPGVSGGPEALHIPVTGHNLVVTIAADRTDIITVNGIGAVVTNRSSLPGSLDLSQAHKKIPETVFSPDLLESIIRSVAGYQRLSDPDAAILLDEAPPRFAMLHAAVAAPPFQVQPGEPVSIVLAPYTESQDLVRWRLVMRFEYNSRVDTPYWDLMLTAETGMSVYFPHGESESISVREIHPDHWDPTHPAPPPDARLGGDELWGLAIHSDGQNFMPLPARPGPEPEPPKAAQRRMKGDAHAASDEVDSAVKAYREAAEHGSGLAAYTLGNLLHRRGELQAALEWQRRAAELRIPAAFNNAGTIALELGDVEQSEQWFRRAMDEGDWTAAMNLAVLLAKRGEVAHAEAILRSASLVDVPQAAHKLSGLLTEQGRLDEAEQVLVRAVERGDRDSSLFGPPERAEVESLVFELMRLRYERQDLQGALGWIRRAMDKGELTETGLRAAANALQGMLHHLASSAAPRSPEAIDVCRMFVAVQRELFARSEASSRKSYVEALELLVELSTAAEDAGTLNAATSELDRLREHDPG